MLPKWIPNGSPKGSKIIPKSSRKNDQKMIKKIPPPGVTGWLRLDRDTVDALAGYRSAHALLSHDEAIMALLSRSSEDVR